MHIRAAGACALRKESLSRIGAQARRVLPPPAAGLDPLGSTREAPATRCPGVAHSAQVSRSVGRSEGTASFEMKGRNAGLEPDQSANRRPPSRQIRGRTRNDRENRCNGPAAQGRSAAHRCGARSSRSASADGHNRSHNPRVAHPRGPRRAAVRCRSDRLEPAQARGRRGRVGTAQKLLPQVNHLSAAGKTGDAQRAAPAFAILIDKSNVLEGAAQAAEDRKMRLAGGGGSGGGSNRRAPHIPSGAQPARGRAHAQAASGPTGRPAAAIRSRPVPLSLSQPPTRCVRRCGRRSPPRSRLSVSHCRRH
jgi:hypothetical protein